MALRLGVGAGCFAAAKGVLAAQQSIDSAALEALDAGAGRYTVSTAEKHVDDVIADVEFSIVEYNYRLTGVNNVGYAIAGRDKTAEKRVARIFHFCSVEVAKQLLAAGDEYLLHMPCRLVVWQEQERIWVAARLLPTLGNAPDALVQKINTMMHEIADFAVSD